MRWPWTAHRAVSRARSTPARCRASGYNGALLICGGCTGTDHSDQWSSKFMRYPAGYDWLATVGTLPRTISEAFRLFGVAEVAGAGSNATILAWRDELNSAGIEIAGFSDDGIAWCGLFAAIVAHRAGKVVPEAPLWARNWANFGQPVSGAALGDVLVFTRPGGGGHVGFYVAEDAEAYHVVGGNQADRVSIARIHKARCFAIRRPAYSQKPTSVRPRVVSRSGALSVNEA